MNNYFFDKGRKSAGLALQYSVDSLFQRSPLLAKSLVDELIAQKNSLKMIASENYCSLNVQTAMGNWLTDKYSEGIVGRRYYAGCRNVDKIEQYANESACKLFGADHAYVQPHSGSDANMVAIWAVLSQRVEKPFCKNKTIFKLTSEEYEELRQLVINQKIMGLSLNSGGHLSHGYRLNCSSKLMQSFCYEVDPDSYLIDYDALAEKAKKVKPLIIIAGYSAYTRKLDFAKFREIADMVGATLIVDMAHFAGLVAGNIFVDNYNPIPFADIVTSTTHKTLRGPRGGLILCKNSFKDAIDKGCPTVLGGPLQNMILAKAVAFDEALDLSFEDYANQIVKNSKKLAETLVKHCPILTNGTDNHMVILDVKKGFSLNGKQAEIALQSCGITSNRNTIPWDTESPLKGSGIRLGVAALTTLGMQEEQMEEIGEMIVNILGNAQTDSKIVDERIAKKVVDDIKSLLQRFSLYPELDDVCNKYEVCHGTRL